MLERVANAASWRGWTGFALLCAGLALALLGGCSSYRLQTRVRNQLSLTSGCPIERIDVPRVRGPLFGAEVCGRRAVYLCMTHPGAGFLCHETPTAGGFAPPASPPPPAAPSPAPPPPAEVASAWVQRADTLYQALADPVRACVPPPTRIQLTLELAADGQVAGVSGIEELPPEQQVCVIAAVQEARVPEGLEAMWSVRFGFR